MEPVDLSNQALADSGGDLSIPLFVAGFIVGMGLGLNSGRGRKSRLVIEDQIMGMNIKYSRFGSLKPLLAVK